MKHNTIIKQKIKEEMIWDLIGKRVYTHDEIMQMAEINPKEMHLIISKKVNEALLGYKR